MSCRNSSAHLACRFSVPALGLQQLEQRRNSEGGVGPEPPARDRRPRLRRISHQHRLEHIFPAIGAVDIARPQSAPLQIAELVEHKQRVQALLLEVAVPDSAFLNARPPTSWRITGSRQSRSASLTSSYPASREKTDWRRRPSRRCRPFLPVRGSATNSAARTVRPRASSSSRWSSSPPSELIEEPRNPTFTERSNCSRRGPDPASPVASTAKSAPNHV